jgi:riboflavin-specific deaminase-like protein
VRRILPEPAIEIDDAELVRMYGYPDGLTTPWVQVNFVSSTDGAVTVDGRAAGLSSPADRRVLALGRQLADVVLVGAGTALIERYRGVRTSEVDVERRVRAGQPEVPPIAVVTRRCSVGPDSRLVTDTVVPPIVLTCAAAPEDRRTELVEAGADVVVTGDHTVDLSKALTALGERGLLRVDCEGGPHLFGELIAEDLVDQLCLTVAPMLVGGDASRIAVGLLPPGPLPLELISVLSEAGDLMLRYARRR